MGQSMATMYRRLLGKQAGGESLLSDLNDHDDDEENLGLFNRLFRRMVQRIIRFLNRFQRRVAGTQPSENQIPINPDDYKDESHEDNSSYNHFIDIEIDDLACRNWIPEIQVTLVEDEDVADGELQPMEQRPLGIDEHVVESLMYDVPITVAENADGELQPMEQRPLGINEHVLESLMYDVPITVIENAEGGRRDDDRLSPVEERPISRRLGPYSWVQKILLVGEGDFSFSASLAIAFDDASNIIATSLDSFEFLMKNYKKAVANILQLTSRGCKVMHGVDATKMANHPQLLELEFDCIIYNFPHAGFANRGSPRNVQISTHQALVGGFLANAKKLIKDDGQIHITHKCVGFFQEWNLEKLGSTEGLRLVEESPFNFRDYRGYTTKFGYGGDGNFFSYPAKRYIFRLTN